ncbi:MAG: sugar phosphate isomerase/epimerase, partial [Brachybacterium sp.]|nr:sugar phosphate isomerase/epimerase [Brachybacterium sp.]
ADGSGRTTKDEHLPPGEGNQPCAEVLRRLANRGWEGSVLLEVTTSSNAEVRERTLRQSLAFARHHLGHHLDYDDDGIDDEDTDGDVGSTMQ